MVITKRFYPLREERNLFVELGMPAVEVRSTSVVSPVLGYAPLTQPTSLVKQSLRGENLMAR